MGLGFVARDSARSFVMDGSKTELSEGTAKDAEISALSWATSVAKDLNCNRVIFEGDCKEIIAAMNHNQNRIFHIQVRVDNCIYYTMFFRSCSFVFCYCECNNVAHRLARWVVSSPSDEVWVRYPRTWLGDAFYSDSILSES